MMLMRRIAASGHLRKRANIRLLSTIDSQEVEKFRNVNWDGDVGKALLNMHDTRMGAIKDYIASRGFQGLNGLNVLDVGCGSGLLSRSLVELGANVHAIDPVEENVDRVKALIQADNFTSSVSTVEDLLSSKGENCFDIVISLEVVEHVNNVPLFLDSCVKLTRNTLILSTVNRTVKSYALAIVAAEHLTGMVPVGTHDWFKFVQPTEIEEIVHRSGLHTDKVIGLVYNPITAVWHESSFETDVNYMYFASA